jgi:aminopeptidase N
MAAICCILLWPVITARSQAPVVSADVRTTPEQSEREKAALVQLITAKQSVASSWFDVRHYRLQLQLDTSTPLLQGRVRTFGTSKAPSDSQVVFDLTGNMRVDSVWLNGARAAFLQNPVSVKINLDRQYAPGDTFSTDIFYQGLPTATGFGSFVFGSHAGIPWVWSLSEPYGARDWWPCKDDPSDKADSADIIVTCDASLKVGSQGLLVSVVNLGNGKSTYHWHEQYPISTYLISIAVSDYAQFSNWFRYSPTDSMEILNYVLTEHLSAAYSSLPKTVDMLSIFSDLFGMYPFIKEKYGHAEFGRGGAMEHQTMTSTTTFSEYTIAHELAHQWFGDMITCRTWSDIWLNEGFAQYSTALYLEKKYGKAAYWDYMNNQMSLAYSAQGVIGMPDTTSVSDLFNNARTYSKAATVLHMLRRVLGDSLFFLSLRNYANSPLLKYSTASTSDFQSVCETTSGKNLSYFFQEWIYSPGYPRYSYQWNFRPQGSTYVVSLALEQSPGSGNLLYFTMPIDIRVSGSGWDSTFTVFNDSLRQQFSFTVPGKPTGLLFDPDGWILKLAIPSSDQPPGHFILDQNYPNPFNPSTTIGFQVPYRSYVTLKVYDVLGREVSTLVEEEKSAGTFFAEWSSQGFPAGVYFYRLTGDRFSETRKMLVVR